MAQIVGWLPYFRTLWLVAFVTLGAPAHAATIEPKIVHFTSGEKTLGGELYLPAGAGPFPVVLYNHGSAPGMLNSEASQAIAPLFIRSGWAFFMPYRRGQGLSAGAGKYIGDEIASAREHAGLTGASEVMTKLLVTEQLDDQLAALEWLKTQSNIIPSRIAAVGNSFGGIEAILGASKATYCAVAAGSPASESWAKAPSIQKTLIGATHHAKSPIFLFQAENDYDLSPNQVLLRELRTVGKSAEGRVYPAFGTSAKDGHSFAYRGSSIWFPDVLAFFQRYCR